MDASEKVGPLVNAEGSEVSDGWLSPVPVGAPVGAKLVDPPVPIKGLAVVVSPEASAGKVIQTICKMTNNA